MITARRQQVEMMSYQGESCGVINLLPLEKIEKKEDKVPICLALPETMADLITEMVGQKESEESAYVEDEPEPESQTHPINPSDQEIMKNLIKNLSEQYDMNGRPVEHPIPEEFLYPVPELWAGEEWQNDIISEKEFNEVEASMGLPLLPVENYQALAASHVPQPIVERSIAYISYMYMKNTTTGNPSKASEAQAKLSKTALDFYAQFGIYAEDKNGLLVNWKTVFYVAHLLRTISTGKAYTIDEDLFSGSQGMDEYDLDNWHANRTHAIRMIVISNLSGDNVEAVYTLDLLMRFRRSMNRATHSITFHKTSDNAPLNQSLCFVNFMKDDGRPHSSWVNIGLDRKVANTVPQKQPYYDGTFCKTCTKHHVGLLYCTTCYCTQYCSMSCMKKDKRLHEEFCSRNAVKKVGKK